MTVVAPPPPLSTSNPNVLPSDARKRRRAILATQRTEASDSTKKRRKQVVSDDDSSDEDRRSSSPKKKPQLKYDPDVPMTKEEATAWRREQRRQRNRLSAAMSRQRQRNHITELEGELDEWKNKYQDVMDKIKAIESANPELVVQVAEEKHQPGLRSLSPEPVQSTVSPGSPTSTTAFLDVTPAEEELKLPEDFLDHTTTAQPPKLISRPALSRITSSLSDLIVLFGSAPAIHAVLSLLSPLTA